MAAATTTSSGSSSTSSSSNNTSYGRTHTNMSNYSTTESVHNEKQTTTHQQQRQQHQRQNGAASSNFKPLSVLAPLPTLSRINSSSITFAPKPTTTTLTKTTNTTNSVYSKTNGGGGAQPVTSSSRTSGYYLRSKIERTRTKALAIAGELTGRNGLERETSNESLRLKMKRSESWDAKNNTYLKYSFFLNFVVVFVSVYSNKALYIYFIQ